MSKKGDGIEVFKESTVEITKIDADKRMVFGFFNVVTKEGEVVLDRQNHMIAVETIEKSAYDFVLNARVAGEMHIKKGVGDLVESMVFTKEKCDAIVETLKKMGVKNPSMDLGIEGWWGGFKVSDDEVLAKIQSGEYSMFSIGGKAEQIVYED